MNKIKVRAHTSYLGNTGYAAHARGFLRELSKYVNLRVRNFNWESADSLKEYINITDLEVLDQITLSSEGGLKDFNICDVDEFKEFDWVPISDFEQDVDLVFIEQSHYYFFQEYKAKYKIAYSVWESTKVSDHFIKTIDKFDAVWVVSQWHKDCLIDQGVNPQKIWIVPEGVDDNFNPDNKIEPIEEYLDGRFKFLFFGRWDYRKSVPEIVKSFLDEFPDEPVDLILSADNKFSTDGLSTEERLELSGLTSSKIKVKHFPSRSDYINYLHNGHVMVTCARSEGWNIPLCEAIAAGIPVVYSNWGAQLEFCENIGNPVDIISEVTSDEINGNYCLPDYLHLRKVLRYIYENYELERKKATNYSSLIRSKFNWVNIGHIGFKSLEEVTKSNKIGICLSSDPNISNNLIKFKESKIDTLLVTDGDVYSSNFIIHSNKIKDQFTLAIDFARNLGYSHAFFYLYGEISGFKLSEATDHIKNEYEYKKSQLEIAKFNVSFVDGPRVDIQCLKQNNYNVKFIDLSNNSIVYETNISSNCWCAPNRKYYTDWLIQVSDMSGELLFEHRIDLNGKRVFVCIESSSLGDSIAWFSGVDEFRKLHNCEMIVSTFNNNLFENNYPDIKFVPPGSHVGDLYALYRIGWYYDNGYIDKNKQPFDPKTRPMQATTFDILGIPFQQVRPKINIPDRPRQIEEPYVCFAMHATAQSKYWNNPTGWQELVDWFNSIGYKVVLISKETNGFMGNEQPSGIIDKTGDISLDDRITDLKHAKMFIGVGSGLSWLAWATGTPVTLISGFSNTETEFFGDDVLRIFNPDTCNSCFNRYMLNAGDWSWCPDHKDTERQFECSKSISGAMVIDKISEFLAKL